MTTQDKTGQKLVDSIRKTKAGAAAAQPETTASTSKPKAKAPARRKPAPKSKPAQPKGDDPYQSGRRVWPD